MKVLIIHNILLLLGVSLAFPSNEESNAIYGLVDAIDHGIAQSINSPKTELRRVVRQAFFGFASSVSRLESIIILNCNITGDKADDLQDTYSDMETCVSKKKILVTPKEEFLTNLEQCAAEAVKKSKNCLPENQKYFPDFLLDLAKSVSSFLYDDADLIREDVSICMFNFKYGRGKATYIQCLIRTAQETNDSKILPPSRDDFCKIVIPMTYCFTNTLKDTCDDTTKLKKFRKDYINAMKRPCGQDEI